MNKDILIKKRDLEINGWKLVPSSYNFQKYNGPIKYITKKNINDEEYFNPLELKFLNRCNDFFILQDFKNECKIPIKLLTCLRNKSGDIIYFTEFYIKKDYKPDLLAEDNHN